MFRGYYRFDQDMPLFDEADTAKVRALLVTHEVRTALKSLRARKLSDLNFQDNDREKTAAVLELIRDFHPDVQLHYADIGIIGSALPYGWEQSVLMSKRPGKSSIWEIEIELSEGEVKFRESDSGPAIGVARVFRRVTPTFSAMI